MTQSNGCHHFRLGDVLTKNGDVVTLSDSEQYREVTIRLWGKGVVLRRIVSGSEIAAQRRFRVSKEQFILSRIDARNGAMGVVPRELDGAVVTNDFPSFNVNQEYLLPSFLGWLSRTATFLELCRAASEGTTNRVRLKEERFFRLELSLPPLDKQRRIVARIDHLAARIEEAASNREQAEDLTTAMLLSAYRRITKKARRRRFGDVAPLNRRPAVVEPTGVYPQVSVRSFGRGSFHKPPLLGSEITWEKPHLVKAGDIVISNIKAWEGAIAVARQEDDGRYGSHRYLTFVPIEGITTSSFLCFHLLTPEGLYNVGEASPGSADRNRTLSARAMLDIPVPLPDFDKQLWFGRLLAKTAAASKVRAEAVRESNAILPAVLDRAFEGAL